MTKDVSPSPLALRERAYLAGQFEEREGNAAFASGDYAFPLLTFCGSPPTAPATRGRRGAQRAP